MPVCHSQMVTAQAVFFADGQSRLLEYTETDDCCTPAECDHTHHTARTDVQRYRAVTTQGVTAKGDPSAVRNHAIATTCRFSTGVSRDYKFWEFRRRFVRRIGTPSCQTVRG